MLTVTMQAMLRFFSRLFRKPSPPLPPGSIPEEYWVADLSSAEASRFTKDNDKRYHTTFDGSTVKLELLRPGLFAWTEVQPYRYRDFSLDMRIQLQADNPADSAGVILRMGDAGSFVCILASDRGLRMDSFFNGEARTIVPWTACPWISMEEGILLSIVARGSRYLVLVDGRFAIEAEDDTTGSGALAFAARSGEGVETEEPTGMAGTAILQSLSIESRPMEVEVTFYRYTRLTATEVEQRRRLTRSLFANSDYLSALIHLKKLDEALASRERLKLRTGKKSSGKPGGPDSEVLNGKQPAIDPRDRAEDAFLRAECYLRLEMYEDAEKAIDTSLSFDPDLPEALEERYNILYLCGRLPDLREGLTAETARTSASPRLSNLLGHACFGLGIWEEGARAYAVAAELDPAMPIYSLNAARAWERAGDMSQAAAAWIQAAHGFFDQSAWEDAKACAIRLKELKYDPAATESLEGRIAYGMGDFETAEKIFARLDRKKAIDAPASYLFGLLLSRKGKRSAATLAFRTAVELDPSEGLYYFRLAESLILSRPDQGSIAGGVVKRIDPDNSTGVGKASIPTKATRDEAEEALAKAMELDPDLPWALNLAGQLAMNRGAYEEAAACFSRAVAGLPEAPEPAINLSAALAAMGHYEKALQALGKPARSYSSAANQRGNVLSLCGRLDEAEAWYREAIALSRPGNRRTGDNTGTMAETPSELAEYRTNLAAVLMEQDRLPEAQDELRSSLESRMDARSLYLMGDIAQQFGDLPRAEAAYRSALDLAPADSGILQRLASLHLMRGHYQKARDAAEALATTDPEASERILASIRRVTQEEISCDSCGRSWMVPKPLPSVPRAMIRGELPDESPAGSCAGCGAVLCVACGKKKLVDGRFSCLQCGGKITLNDDRIRWIVRDFVRQTSKTP